MIKYVIAIISFCGIYNFVHAQQPLPVSIDKVSAGTGGLVAINGSGFGNDKTKLAVFFGAAKGEIETASEKYLEVHAPPGATYDNLSITNITSGLTGYTIPHFLLSFGAEFGFDNTNLIGQTDFTAGAGLFDHCLCDFNGDTKVDIATANDNIGATTISILTNTSTGPGNINFTSSTVAIGARSLHIRCGDLNGDGKPDLVVSEGGIGERVFVFQNNSGGTISFQAPIIINIPGTKTKQVQIADLDSDGRPEVIITDQIGKDVSVLVNQSAANISFAALIPKVRATGAATTDGLAVDDLNGDGRPEIIVGQFLTTNSNIFISENKSTPGNISFGTSTTVTANGSIVNIKVGDLDGDGKPDIAATRFLPSSTVAVFRNTTTGSAITLDAEKPFFTDDRPWGLDFGDLDGDGRADIAVTSPFKKSVTVLNNISAPGNVSFQMSIKPTTYINRHIAVGDLDGDGKPDISFTSIDDKANNILASQISVFRNKTCMVPVLTPTGPLAVCAGFLPLRLFSTVSRGVTYEWKLNGTTLVSGTDPFFDITTGPGGDYTVTAKGESGSCSEVSNSVTINVGTGTATGTAVASNDGPACTGSTTKLLVNNVGATDYNWTGPNGYTGSGLNPSITNFQPANVGRYYVDIIAGGCLVQRASTLVEIIDIPAFQINAGSNVICQGDTKVLSLSPVVSNPASFSYIWTRNGTAIGGATSPTYSATVAGSYVAKVTFGSCLPSTTDPMELEVVALPDAVFSSSPSVCANQKAEFTNQSTSDSASDVFYTWTFGDGNTSTEKDPTHIYSTANTFTVKLVVSYGGGSCPDEVSKTIEVTPAPPVSITSTDIDFKFCEGDSIKLDVLGTFDSYTWNTSETTPSIFVKDPGIFSVDVEASNGCVLTANREVIRDPAPQVVITANPPQINEGESTQLEAIGLDNYSWTPAETLTSSSTIANPIAQPTVTTTYTVTGAVGVGCPGFGTIEIVVRGEAIVNKLNPSNFFSPNKDDRNDLWGVENILSFPQCGVSIYDDKGIKVYEAKPYLNDWDGTFKGKKLPDGVYYFIIRCDGEESKPRAGSITVLR